MFWNEFRIHKTSKFVLLLMKSSQSNFNLRSPGSYLVCSYLITTVNLVMISLVASKCQEFKVEMPVFQPFYEMKLKTSKFKVLAF